jgi:hypothetical protein
VVGQSVGFFFRFFFRSCCVSSQQRQWQRVRPIILYHTAATHCAQQQLSLSVRLHQPRRTVKKTKQNKFHNNRMIRFRRCFYTTNAAAAATNLEIVKEINKKKRGKTE